MRPAITVGRCVGRHSASCEQVTKAAPIGNPRDEYASCAIVWTRNKVCRQHGWQNTQPLPPADHAQAWDDRLARGFEPAITLRTSGLVGFEADGDEDAMRLKDALVSAKVTTWAVEGRQADDGTRLHAYARQPEGIDLPKVSYRFEGGTIVAALNNYYRCAYEGGPYELWSMDDLAPRMTREAYAYFQQLSAKAERQQRADRAAGEPLPEGSRRNNVFRFACFLSRWTSDEALAVEIVDLWQQSYCVPPIPVAWVAQQVAGAWKVAHDDDRLGCEVNPPPTHRLIVYALAEDFARGLGNWTTDSELVARIVQLWVTPLAKVAP